MISAEKRERFPDDRANLFLLDQIVRARSPVNQSQRRRDGIRRTPNLLYPHPSLLAYRIRDNPLRDCANPGLHGRARAIRMQTGQRAAHSLLLVIFYVLNWASPLYGRDDCPDVLQHPLHLVGRVSNDLQLRRCEAGTQIA